MRFLTLLYLCFFSAFSYSQVEKHHLLSHWSLITEGSKGGNTIRALERRITTPQARYAVASMTLMELNFSGDRNLDSTRSFLQKEFRLNGLQEKTYEGTHRFEGYRKDLNRQVVVFVSFTDKKIKVSSGFYRPSYGQTIALEVEFLHRKYHKVKDAVSYSPLKFKLPFIEEAYAQEDCTRCAGNPVCLLLCRAGNTGSTGGLVGSSGNSLINLSGIEKELNNTNTQLTAINGNVGVLNGNWSNTNTQLGGFNANWSNTNTQIGVFNNNFQQTNQNLDQLNQTLQNTNQIVDKNAQKALEESQAWRAMTEKESAEWRAMMKEQSDRGLVVAEKMADPNHLFKMATYSAAGAVLGATVANLAISGVQMAVGFLYKWATGQLKDEKMEKLLQEFNMAMKVYDDSSKIAKGLEASIDTVLSNMALHKKFSLENSEVLGNIQKFILTTEFEIEDAKKNRCIEDLVTLNQKMVEFKSLAKILDMADPQKQMCLDLKEMFRKIAEIEGVLQNARPNLLKAEEALNYQKAKAQNDGAETLDDIQKGKVAKNVRETQDKQRKKLYEKNLEDTEKLAVDIEDDCKDSFKELEIKLPKKSIVAYCQSMLDDKEKSTDSGMTKAIPELTSDQRLQLTGKFKKKYIPLGLDKMAHYNKEREKLFTDFESEMNRHHDESVNLKDRLQMDPRIALDEMKAINEFTEKLMKEQAYIYTDGMKARKAKFDEACSSMK